MTRALCRSVILVLILVLGAGRSAAADSVPPTLEQELAAARSHLDTATCAAPSDVLERILCDKVLRVGVRTNYPGFGLLQGNAYSGYDIDVALEISRRLGVRMEPVPVTPSNRIAMVSNGTVDLVVATMGYTMQRQKQVGYVSPPYYQSHTSVVGPRQYRMPSGGSLAGLTVCVPIANASSGILARRGARLMIFDAPEHLLDALKFQRCTLVAHDDSYFAPSMVDRAFAARYEEKLEINPAPWEIGIAKEGSSQLSRLVSRVVTDLHRSGRLIELAHKNNVSDKFLVDYRARLVSAACLRPDGLPPEDCLIAPQDDLDPPTSFAPTVVAIEAYLKDRLDIDLALPMLKSRQAFNLFVRGVVNTIVLVIGSIGMTVAFALIFYAGLRRQGRMIGVAAQVLATLIQSSPIVLLLILGYFIMTAVLTYDASVALLTAIIVLGLANGSNAGSAMADAARTLTIEGQGQSPRLGAVMCRSLTQITGFAANAVRGGAVASVIGTPELLTVMTDIASVSNVRKSAYTVLLLFYLVIVLLLVAASRWLSRRFASTATAA